MAILTEIPRTNSVCPTGLRLPNGSRLIDPVGQSLCGVESLDEQAIAVYEDFILPDDYQGEWFGAPVCLKCWAKVDKLQAERPGEILTTSEVRKS